MKRITTIGALMAIMLAALLPDLAQAQNFRTLNSRGWGGSPYEPGYSSFGSGGRVGDTLADDISADVHVDVSNNPILACSGLDIRDSIKAMLDLDSLSADLKNYLKSLLAKEALALAYSSPAIAGVLDGLKAFGNARFQLAQNSCEAIEGEISAQSRYLRQQAFEECLRKNEGAENALLTCSTETGSYAAGLEEFLNSGEAAARGNVSNWISRLNVGGVDSVSGICEGLGANKPSACTGSGAAQAAQVNAGISQIVTDEKGNIKAIVGPAVSPNAMVDNAIRNAAGAGGTHVLAMLAVTRMTNGSIDEAGSLVDQIANKRIEAYASAMEPNNVLTEEAANAIFNRNTAENIFVGAAREMTVNVAADIEQRHPGVIAGEFRDGDIDPNAHTGKSYHYRGQAIDFNCNSAPNGERACLTAVYNDLNANRTSLGIVELDIEEAGEGASTGLHLHVAFGGSSSTIGGAGPFANGAVAEEISEALSKISSDATEAQKLSALEVALAKVPLIPEDACYYELDGKKENGLEDISDPSKIFSANTVANALARQAAEAQKKSGEKTKKAAKSIQNSVTAQVQQLNLTGGRLALCLFISNVPRDDEMLMQFTNSRIRGDYLREQANKVATWASLTIYDGLIQQVQQAQQASNTDEAPPSIDRQFIISLEMLRGMRASVISSAETRASFGRGSEKLRNQIRGEADSNARDTRQGGF